MLLKQLLFGLKPGFSRILDSLYAQKIWGSVLYDFELIPTVKM